GRTMNRDGWPINLSEMLGLLDGAVYIERVAVNSVKNILNAKKAITKAFKVQMANLGFSMVEILSPCPTNWKMTPVEACKWIDETMTKAFPIKVIKDQAGKI
ncbi:MAG: 2-oxoglutarate oxidoreductase, partial [Deltaproteobacteria bacterium]|nr:2-oxoglutarate oxidoreductase [Deltaproteobacteria bacterium]